jgi:hypothetical protein
MRGTKLIGVLAVALLIAGCGKLVIVQDKTQTLIKSFVKSHGATATDVRCPAGVAAKKGNSFDCHFTALGQHYVAHMHILRIKGNSVFYNIQTAPSG